jgi:hypothetical protein
MAFDGSFGKLSSDQFPQLYGFRFEHVFIAFLFFSNSSCLEFVQALISDAIQSR